jgi:hypothetical protein
MKEREDFESIGNESTGQSQGVPSPPPTQEGSTIAPSSKRQAFRNVGRQLTDEELTSPGVPKLILDELERTEADCEILKKYVEQYHDADKRAAILEEKLKTHNSIEIFFGVGIGIGCTIIGLAPLFWNEQPKGYIALIVGALLTVGATVGRLVKR